MTTTAIYAAVAIAIALAVGLAIVALLNSGGQRRVVPKSTAGLISKEPFSASRC